MNQLTTQLKSGKMEVREVPTPLIEPGCVLVKNHFSLISAGTEGSTVKAARKNLIGKAKERPAQVKQAIDLLKSQGLLQTYRTVMKKLDAYAPLGYSTCGEVIEVGEGVEGFSIGDKVACAGNTASHAEVVSVPVNLCVKLTAEANLQQAAYNTLGAIAMQGVRQADLRLGESCAVIGLGLLGQLTCQLLKASGVAAFGIDIDPSAVELTKKHFSPNAFLRDTPGLDQAIKAQTSGQGVDAVIITAGTPSLDPVNFSGKICRKKGKVVIVGAVPTGFDREDYFKKEIDLRMSCSYGPGRYDIQYEDKGIDYPYAYVRWTEKRNMEAFQQLLASGQIDIAYLTSHVFPLEKAPVAYDMVLSKSEPFFGILIQYDTEKTHQQQCIQVHSKKGSADSKIGVAFIGAGSYAMGNLLPNIPNGNHISRIAVLSRSGTTSKRVAEKYGFEFCSSELSDILDNDAVNTVFVATRHDTHGDYVKASLKKDKHVFVEKPICLYPSELEEIQNIYQHSKGNLMVGFNRRFAPLSMELKKRFTDQPMSIIYRVNAGHIPGESWIQDMQIGGGRIIGEACHFIDYLRWLTGSPIKKVHALAMPDPAGHNDTVSINLQFENGSIGTVHYFANGSKSLPKEYIEVYQTGQSAVLTDFKMLEIFGKSVKKIKNMVQDKGQKNMMAALFESLVKGDSSPIPAEEIFETATVTFAAVEALKN